MHQGGRLDSVCDCGGFYLVEAENVDEAIEIAARIPGARYGTIEVRPVLPMGAEAASA